MSTPGKKTSLERLDQGLERILHGEHTVVRDRHELADEGEVLRALCTLAAPQALDMNAAAAIEPMPAPMG
jgi:hypothetical protein